ncbi:MAG: glycosyltransferase family 2 protein [Actinobacteria bacterium]|nr:glycosyltransferase family 2 protein [Actinomycetota bacterium]
MEDSSPGRTRIVLTVVLPAHNEAEILEASVADFVGGLRVRRIPFEVVVVENGSRDATPAIADRIATNHPEVSCCQLPAADYGNALRTGFLAARGATVVNFDVDFYDLGFVDDALLRMAEPDQPVIVVGSKRAEGADDRRSPQRKLVTGVFSWVLQFGFGLRLSDTHGMKAMRRDPLVPIVERCQFGTDLFDTELILRAERAGLHAVELPVVVVERRPARSPIWRRIPRTLWGLVRLRILLGREASRATR